MSSFYFDVALGTISLLIASYFAFLETAFTSLRLYKVKELENELGSYQYFFNIWKTAPQKILTTILITNNFFSILCSVLITRVMEENLGEWGVAAGVALATLIILLFGDIVPKTFAKSHQGKFFKMSLGILNTLLKLLKPVVKFFLVASTQVLKLLGINASRTSDGDVSEAEIEFLIGYSDEKGIIETEKSEMLQNIFGLGLTAVSKIMVPKNDMKVCNVDLGVENAKKMLIEHRYSRLPLFKGKEDNIIGMVYHKDLFGHEVANDEKTLKDLIHPVLFLPESKKINQLLKEFLSKRMHMGIIVDEHGAVAGLVTLEDILEEIVGEIRDEHEKELPGVITLTKGGWLINAGMPLEDVGEILEIEFEVESSITLAGFMMEELQRLPKVGEKVVHCGYEFVVNEASAKRVFQVKVTKIEHVESVEPE
jgi:putative hemolysin